MSVLVPPMSIETTLGRWHASASAAPPMTPAATPELSVLTAYRPAWSGRIVPPPFVITSRLSDA